MNEKQTNGHKESRAFQYMTLDILKNVLAAADHLRQLSEYLTNQMRELTGAKTVALSRWTVLSSGSTDRSLLHVCPSRKTETFEEFGFCGLRSYCGTLSSPVFFSEDSKNEAFTEFAAREGCRNALLAPLCIGCTQVGSLLFIDLPEAARASEVMEVLEPLTPVVAALLRNAFLFENLEEKVAERTKALQTSERKYRNLVEITPDWVWAINGEGNYTFTNNAITKILGYEPAEFAHLDFFSLVHEDERERLKKGFHTCTNNKTGWQRIPIQVVHKDGSSRYVESTAEPIIDKEGRLQGFTGIDRDITSTVRADKLFNTLVNSMIGSTGQACFDRMVESLCEWLGVECAVVGELQPDGQINTLSMRLGSDLVKDFSYPLAGSPCEHVMESGFCYVPSSACSLYPDDAVLAQLKAESYAGTPLIDSEGKTIGILCCVSTKPLTLPPKAEELMKILAVRTSTEVQRLRSDRRQQQMEAQARHAQKFESLGVLAGGIAHDFNNLLMTIMGNANLAEMDLPPNSPVRGYMGDIEVAAQRAADLCYQMLAYSGQGRFIIAAVNLTTLVKEMRPLLNAAVSKKTELIIDLDSFLPSIEADAGQMHQVIVNLVTNAAEAIGDNVGHISIRTYLTSCLKDDLHETFLNEELSEGEYVCLEVTDTGPGMDAETCEKVVEPFFTTKFTGRGLGLAAVLGIVRGHHGALKIDSTPGMGSSFKILLPTSKRAAPHLATKISHINRESEGQVLLVDDDEDVRNVTSRMLNKAGFDVITAKDGLSGVETFKKSHRDLRIVVLDMAMPKMNGYETLIEMRKINAGVPVIIASGYSVQLISEDFSGNPPDGFIQKPYMRKELIDKVFSVLGETAR